ncbi:opioid growth factor receptor isoform X2 [Ictalurus punctatus]|uniref:Opioid growth factor receptor isoform X2 n=1 Tax=Ictalurus punctatus TaxID=7998 RepID=A0A9F7QYC3_ICTPU|nr:opioid growth factor receptor isoform X2 [Ictalurus punctatus]
MTSNMTQHGKTKVMSSMQWSHRNTHAAKDMQTFRHKFRKTQHDDSTDDYLEDDEELPNLRFYQNNMPFYPDSVLIKDFHNFWFGDYDRLEYVHSYIQWLFPIQEKGMNYASRELSLKEIKLFRTDEEVQRRLLTSYKLMLDFYGIELVSEDSGEVKRAKNWKEQFANLNRNTHNNLRITRILKCLGLLGFRHYQKPLVHFFLEETLVNNQLPRVKYSVLDYFMFAVLDKDERKDLIKYAYCHFKPKEDFVWCPRRIRNKLEKETVSHKLNAGSNEGESSDSTSQSEQNDLMNSRVHKKNEFKTDTNEDTGNNKSLRCESRNDENVSGESQDSEEQASPVPAVGNANTIVTNEEQKRTEGPSRVDSQHEAYIDSDGNAAIQKDDKTATNKEIPNSVQNGTNKSDENGSEYADSTEQSKVLSGDETFDSSTAIDKSTNKKQTQTSNQSSRIENVANETPASGGNSGSVEQNQGEKFDNQGDTADNQGDKSENQVDKSENQGDKSENQGDKSEIQKVKSENQGDKSDNQGDKSEIQKVKSENQGDESDNQGDKSDNQGDKSDNQGDKAENQGDKAENQGDKSENQGDESENQGDKSEFQKYKSENPGDKAEQGNKDKTKSQYTDGDSKEIVSEEIHKSGHESPKDSVATGTGTNTETNSACYDEEKSADKNSHKYTTTSPGQDNASDQNSVSSKRIHTPGSDRNIEHQQQESGQVAELLNAPKSMANFSRSQPDKDAQSKCGPNPDSTTLMKTPESDENMGNPHNGSEQQNQGDEMLNTTAEANTKETSV